MNSKNSNSQKNDHKPSEDDGPQTLVLLQKIKDGQINPKSIGKKEGKLLARFLKNENKSTPEIAHVLSRSDRTIRRYIEELEEEDAITKDPKLVGQMAGGLKSEAELCKQRIRKSARGNDTPASVKVDAEHRCFQIDCLLIEKFQSLGFLPTAAQKVTAELKYQAEEVLTLEQIDKEVKILQQIEGNPSKEENTENEIITQFEDESDKEKGNQNGNTL